MIGQPQRAFEVEIVGRLIEQQQIGLGEQHRRERNPHAPAAGEIRARTLLRGFVEAEACEDRGRARGRRVRADVGKPRLNLRDTMRVARSLGFGEQLRSLGVGGEHDIDQPLRPAWRFLCEPPDARARRHVDAAVLDPDLARDRRGTASSCRCRCGRSARRARLRECARMRRPAGGGRQCGPRCRRARARRVSKGRAAEWQAHLHERAALAILASLNTEVEYVRSRMPGSGRPRTVAPRIFWRQRLQPPLRQRPRWRNAASPGSLI